MVKKIQDNLTNIVVILGLIASKRLLLLELQELKNG
jgi:hypothetical protein